MQDNMNQDVNETMQDAQASGTSVTNQVTYTPQQIAEAQAIPVITATMLAASLGMKATSLRRILRGMPEYADGIHTNYAWLSYDSPDVQRIIARVNATRLATQARYEAAQASLAERIAEMQARIVK